MQKLTVRRADETELAKFLRSRVIGQDAAINAITDQYVKMQAGLNDSTKPMANFLFLGPTGVGKTRVVEALCEFLFDKNAGDDRDKPLKISCGEFQSDHEISKLIGSPAGYLGHGETKPFLNRSRVEDRKDKFGRKINVILFDEIEKAGKAFFNLLLGVLDRAELTDNKGTQINFSHTFIFMTSNLGVKEMTNSQGPSLGFVFSNKSVADWKSVAIETARNFFSPEQFNRIDEVIAFDALTEDVVKQIIDIELKSVATRAIVALDATPEAKAHILERGYDVRYGARNVKRAIDRLVVRPLASLLATKDIQAGHTVAIQYGVEGLEFYRAGAIEIASTPQPAPVTAVAAAPAVKKYATETVSAARLVLDCKFKNDTTSQQGRLYQWLRKNPGPQGRYFIVQGMIKDGFQCNQDPDRAIGYYLNEWTKKGWLTRTYGGYELVK